jgi:hypothetical protein
VQLLLGITSASKLGTGQANAPEFGTGRTILIHGHCQSGKWQDPRNVLVLLARLFHL